MKTTAIYPGSFDPVTNGHLDIINRASLIFDNIIVAVLKNCDKNYFFTLNERVSFLEKSCKQNSNVKVISFNGLTVECARSHNSNIIIRGLRNSHDFNYEFNMSVINKELCHHIETIFIPCNKNEITVSSSLIKQIILLGGDASEFIPKCICNEVKNKLLKSRRKYYER